MNSMGKTTSLLAIAVLGCAPGAGPNPASAPAVEAGALLSYAPQGAPLTYVTVDSGSMRLEIPQMGPIDVLYDLNATTRLTLTQAADGLAATITVTALSGQLTNPAAGGATPVDNSLIPRDPARLTVTPAGVITSASLPELSRTLREVTTGSTLFRALFVKLPAGAVRPGATWSDTVDVNDQLGAMTMKQRQAWQSTYTGDTVVAGRRLARIDGTAELTIGITGEANGMQIEQRLTGQGRQRVLWDRARGVLVERAFENSATGSMTVLGAGMGDIPVTQRSRSVARLHEGG